MLFFKPIDSSSDSVPQTINDMLLFNCLCLFIISSCIVVCIESGFVILGIMSQSYIVEVECYTYIS